jgi:hypothetical protein
MNVRLYKQDEADFNLQEEKCEKLSYKTLCMLTDYKEGVEEASNSPKMVAFKTKEEFQKEAWRYNIDTDKEVLINSKGSIFCYLKEEHRTPEKSESGDGSTDSE